jgi:hypothetical protein
MGIEMKSIAGVVLSALLAIAEAKAKLDPDPPPDYNEETDVGMPVTVETFFAMIFVAMIASVPFILVKLKGTEELTQAHYIESGVLLVWLTGTLFLFTNVLKFGSGHFTGIRPLTIVEAVYVLAQVLTTVGYGDITPALPRGQVWVAINVILALCLYGSIISEVTEIVQERIADYMTKQKNAQGDSSGLHALAGQMEDQYLRSASGYKIGPKTDKFAPPLRNWKIEANIDYGPLKNSAIAFTISATVGVLFWHYYPGENKTWLQAIYMSVITLSTVGFGWFNAVTEGGKVFGAFWMMFGVASLAAVLTNWCEIMTKLKQVERMNEDEEKLYFFKLIAREGEEARDKNGNPIAKQTPRTAAASGGQQMYLLEDRAMDVYEFMKFGLLLRKQVTEEDLQRIEDRFFALGPDKDGLVSRRVIEENETPPAKI